MGYVNIIELVVFVFVFLQILCEKLFSRKKLKGYKYGHTECWLHELKGAKILYPGSTKHEKLLNSKYVLNKASSHDTKDYGSN